MGNNDVVESSATGQHSSTVNDLVRGHKESSKSSLALNRFPVEIQRNIYANLLDSDSVRQQPDRHLIYSYRFDTAILSGLTRRAVHGQQAHRRVTQLGNHAESFEPSRCFRYIHQHESNVAWFRQYFHRLHIAFPPSFKINNSDQITPWEISVLASFLLLQNDLDRLARMLNILSFKTQSDKRSLLLQNHFSDGVHAT
ncbi:MAG: hypothetical protein Q9197_001594 [Variospora fuerteventurae]